MKTLNQGYDAPSHWDRLKTPIDLSTGSWGRVSLGDGGGPGQPDEGLSSTVYIIAGDGEIRRARSGRRRGAPGTSAMWCSSWTAKTSAGRVVEDIAGVGLAKKFEVFGFET